MWTEEAVARYEQWYEKPPGSFALVQEQHLIAGLVSAWPRRNHRVLEIGCGAGHFLELFYHLGFDVTGLDSSQAMLDAAGLRMGNKATLRLGQAQHLPFDDSEFDYAALVTSLECMEDPDAALAEAFRVAAKGVVIVFLNSWSCYWAERKLRSFWNRLGLWGIRRETGIFDTVRWYSMYSMAQSVRKACGVFPSCFRSVLFSPSVFWGWKVRACPARVQWLPFGAVMAVRVDLSPLCGITTPLPAGKVFRLSA